MPDYKLLVRRYYSEIWNEWSEPALEELISPDVGFHGSIGTAVKGIAEFKRYVNRIRSAFPDFHNQVEELIAEGHKAAARLIYTGTHREELLGFPGTGNKISYQGLAIFEFKQHRIVKGYVLGDIETLKKQLAQK
ncbi:MAG: ester cyclase [Acidobacteria bacterium]|nr:MAG: ester cyclase [Acidobacteriota bacterium]